MSCVFISITISSPGRRLTWSSEIDLDAKANLNRSDVSLQQRVTSHNTVLLEGCNRGFPDRTCVGMSQNQWPSKPIDLIDYFRSQFLGP